MNFEHLLEEHIMDHRAYTMFNIGPVQVSMSHHLKVLWGVCAFVILAFTYAARSQSALARGLRAALEPIILYVRDEMLHPIFHDDTEAFLPYFLTLFFFVWIANMAGLIPEVPAVTGNFSVTMGLALCTFMLIHVSGAKKQGPVGYVTHIVPGGLPQPSFSSLQGIVLAPLVMGFRGMIFLIEVLGVCAKCFALCIRLFANMVAGHVVSLAFLSLIFIMGASMGKAMTLGVVAPAAVGLTVFVALLDLLVALLQAYIFTILTALFVGMAVHPH